MHPSYIINSHEDQKTSSCSNINYNPVVLEKKCLTAGKIKKDRHSKINTARGPRDRRMRLSLDVAKKFFGLQDMLGFDKASNTIEWLMMNSKQAIQDLWSQQLSNIIGVSNSPSSASECEVLSDDHHHNMILIKKETHNFNSCSSNKEHKKVQRVRKGLYFNQSLAKETRDKARARARKRTSEKKNIKLGYDYDYDVAAGCHQYSKLRPGLDQIIMDQNMNRFGSWIPFGENQVQLTDQIPEYPSSHSSMMSSNLSPSFLFNYQHNPAFYNEHQFSDLQMLDKPIWEGLNN